MKDFKQEIQDSFIPMVKRMIDKENEHLNMLFNLSDKYKNLPEITSMIVKSQNMISHLEYRLKEYENFVK